LNGFAIYKFLLSQPIPAKTTNILLRELLSSAHFDGKALVGFGGNALLKFGEPISLMEFPHFPALGSHSNLHIRLRVIVCINLNINWIFIFFL
jgi:hypothetical protein